jgi:hypothetical protein
VGLSSGIAWLYGPLVVSGKRKRTLKRMVTAPSSDWKPRTPVASLGCRRVASLAISLTSDCNHEKRHRKWVTSALMPIRSVFPAHPCDVCPGKSPLYPPEGRFQFRLGASRCCLVAAEAWWGLRSHGRRIAGTYLRRPSSRGLAAATSSSSQGRVQRGHPLPTLELAAR